MISIIVPVYNVEQYLDICLQSIASQSYDSFEVIMVNDGSTDGSKKICEKWESSDCRFKLINQVNEGVSAARNTGLNNISGDFVCFVDSDDVITARYLESLIAHMEDDIDIVECGYQRFKTYPPEKNRISSKSTYYTIGTDIFRRYLNGNGLAPVVWNKLYRRNVLRYNNHQIYFPMGRTMEDAYFLTDVFGFTTKKVKVIEAPLYCYREREGSAMKQTFSVRFMESSFLQYEHRIEVARRVAPELVDLCVGQLCSDFFQYYRLIYLNRVVDDTGEKHGCYSLLHNWQDKWLKYLPLSKQKILLMVLRIYGPLVRLIM